MRSMPSAYRASSVSCENQLGSFLATNFLAALMLAIWNRFKSRRSTLSRRNSSQASRVRLPVIVRRSPSRRFTTSFANAFSRVSACSTVRSPRVRSEVDSKISASIQRVKISRQAYKSRFDALDERCCKRVDGNGASGAGRTEIAASG